MSNPWFRFYREFMNDPVIQSLAFEDQRHYVIILCLKCDGVLDRNITLSAKERIILRALGLDSVTGDEVKRRLLEVGLITKKWNPKGWEKRQYLSDSSTQRTRKYRKTKETGNVPGTVKERHGDAPETDTDTDTEKHIPDWLNPETWEAFRKHRKQLKAPMTPEAEKRAINKLTKLKQEGHNVEAIINESIVQGWKGLFEPKDKPKQGSGLYVQ